MAQLKLYGGGFYLWEYVPSKPAVIVFTIVFGLATLFIMWRIPALSGRRRCLASPLPSAVSV